MASSQEQVVSFVRCQKPELILSVDDEGLEDELKKRMLQQEAAEEEAAAVVWSGQTSAPLPPCWEWPPRKAEKGLPRSIAAPQPPSSGDAESAFSASPLLGRFLLATSPS